MSFDENFASWDDVNSAPPTVPLGEYSVRIVDPKVEKTKDQREYIAYRAIVDSGPHAGYSFLRGMFSLKSDQVWKFKRDTKAIGFAFDPGLSVVEAARAFVQQIGGTIVRVKLGLRPRQVKNEDTGEYVNDPEGTQENTIQRWIELA